LSITQVVTGSTAIHLSSVEHCGFTIEQLAAVVIDACRLCGLIDVWLATSNTPRGGVD
jgi:hypothetical protein